jgi:hypothetical protein
VDNRRLQSKGCEKTPCIYAVCAALRKLCGSTGRAIDLRAIRWIVWLAHIQFGKPYGHEGRGRPLATCFVRTAHARRAIPSESAVSVRRGLAGHQRPV